MPIGGPRVSVRERRRRGVSGPAVGLLGHAEKKGGRDKGVGWAERRRYTTGKTHIRPRPLVPVTVSAGTNVQI